MNPRIVNTLFATATGIGIAVGVTGCAGGYVLYSLFGKKNKPADLPAIQAEPLPFSMTEIAKALQVDPDRIRKIETDNGRTYMEVVFKPSFDAHHPMECVSADLRKHDVENHYFKQGPSISDGPVLRVYRDGKADFINYVKNKNTQTIENQTSLRN